MYAYIYIHSQLGSFPSWDLGLLEDCGRCWHDSRHRPIIIIEYLGIRSKFTYVGLTDSRWANPLKSYIFCSLLSSQVSCLYKWRSVEDDAEASGICISENLEGLISNICLNFLISPYSPCKYVFEAIYK